MYFSQIGLLSILVTNPLAMAGVGAGFGAYGAVNTGTQLSLAGSYCDVHIQCVVHLVYMQLDSPILLWQK